MQNKNGCTSLMFTAVNGDIDIARLLIEHGADLNIKNKKGKVFSDVLWRRDITYDKHIKELTELALNVKRLKEEDILKRIEPVPDFDI
jgi:hypothetical protein